MTAKARPSSGRHGPERSASPAWRGRPAILEAFIAFEQEISVIAVRGSDGRSLTYDLCREHAPRSYPGPFARARRLSAPRPRPRRAHRRAHRRPSTMSACWRSRCSSPARARVLVNEIAPRVHNSGHWTLDACLVSQFENHVRAVCGWPLGSTERHSDAVMTNLIGDDVAAWPRAGGRAARRASSLRQAGGAARPQDGARHPDCHEELRSRPVDSALPF